MKKLWKISGIIVLGMVFLTGCGNGQTGAVPIVQPVKAEKSGTESNGQSGRDQDAADQESGQIILTLGTLDMDRRLQNAVEAYNAQNGRYYVEIVNYLPEQYDNVVWKASRDRFCMELTAGKGPDIVDLGGLAAEELGYAGVLADLNMFLTQEEKSEKYLGSILECVRTGEALYDISPAFTLEFIAGDGSRIGMETGWTMEEMLMSFEKEGRDGTALGRSGAGITTRLVQYSMTDYVDWDTGTADFCKEEFYSVLEFGKAADKGELFRPTRESVASGIHLAGCEQLAVPADIQRLKWLYGDNMTVKGYPCCQGTGVAVNICDGSMGISTYSQYAEGAWDFLEFYVGAFWTKKEFYAEETLMKGQFSDMFPGFPLNRQLFEEELEYSMIQHYTDSGEPLAFIWGEGDMPDFYANTAEDVENLRKLIGLADRRKLTAESVIGQILEEEIRGYNNGILTAEQTAEKIQERVQLYLDERK